MVARKGGLDEGRGRRGMIFILLPSRVDERGRDVWEIPDERSYSPKGPYQ